MLGHKNAVLCCAYYTTCGVSEAIEALNNEIQWQWLVLQAEYGTEGADSKGQRSSSSNSFACMTDGPLISNWQLQSSFAISSNVISLDSQR